MVDASAAESAAPSFFRNLRAILAIAGPRRRLQLYATLVLMVLGALAELVTIGAVLPLLALAADETYASGIPIVQAALKALGAGPGTNLMIAAAAFLVVAAILSTVLRLMLTWVSEKLVYGLQHDIVMRIFERAVRQPYDWYVKQHSSVIVSGLEKVHFVVVGILTPSVMAVTSGGIALCIIAFLVFIDPVAALVAATSIGLLYVAISMISNRTLKRVSEGLAAVRTRRVKTVQESLGGIRDIILDHSQTVFERKLEADESELRRLLVLSSFNSALPRLVVEGMSIILVAIMAVWFSFQPGGVKAAIPVLGALALGAQRLLPLLQKVYLGYAGYAVHTHSLHDVVKLMNAPVATASALPEGQSIRPFGDRIELRDVAFGYSPDMLALSKVNLVIRKGERIGLIGKTGSGKSTLVDLLMGLLPPTKGAILLGGERLDESNLNNWQAQVSHVPQFIFLSDESIAANIAFGCSEAEIDMDRVREAAGRADIRDFVEQLPAGFATRVGERGIRLSGGQRQRIGIARALYKRATVLILDEATSALDEQTEAAIMESVAKLDRDLTVILIAHRLSTVATCDRIYRLEEGRIVESGSFEDVVVQGARTGRSSG
jgi:ATP-binding cassette, subfamily B, bacterial PglK